MDKRPTTRSAILYQDPGQSIFILDIPRSIELAQQLQESPQTLSQPHSEQQELRLISCPALEYPYTAPAEPKTDAARQKVLERIPISEQQFHASVVPEVKHALKHVQQSYSGPLCLERYDPLTAHHCNSSSTDDGRTDSSHKTLTRGRSSKLPSSNGSIPQACAIPPIILAPGTNHFPSFSSVQGSIVRNHSKKPVVLQITHPHTVYTVPPQSAFLNSHLAPISAPPDVSTPKFDLLLLDPPWPNRSVRRSSHYQTTPSVHDLSPLLDELVSNHFSEPECAFTSHGGTDTTTTTTKAGVVGIWTTNTSKARDAVSDVFRSSNLTVSEEWIWVKCAANQEPVLPLEGVWRKPYEVIVWGRKQSIPTKRKKKKRKRKEVESSYGEEVKRRVILAVPDLHSRKPNLKELVERVFFSSAEGIREYSAMEVFARHLTAGWWACGDEVLQFNSTKCWEKQK